MVFYDGIKLKEPFAKKLGYAAINFAHIFLLKVKKKAKRKKSVIHQIASHHYCFLVDDYFRPPHHNVINTLFISRVNNSSSN